MTKRLGSNLVEGYSWQNFLCSFHCPLDISADTRGRPYLGIGKQVRRNIDSCWLEKRGESYKCRCCVAADPLRAVHRGWDHPRRTASQPRRVTTMWIRKVFPPTSPSLPWGSLSLLAQAVALQLTRRDLMLSTCARKLGKQRGQKGWDEGNCWTHGPVGRQEMNRAAALHQGQKSCLFHASGSLWRRNNGKHTVILAFTWSLVIKKKRWAIKSEQYWTHNLKDTNDPSNY